MNTTSSWHDSSSAEWEKGSTLQRFQVGMENTQQFMRLMSLDDYGGYEVSQDCMSAMSSTDPGDDTRLSVTSAASRCCELMDTEDFSLVIVLWIDSGRLVS